MFSNTTIDEKEIRKEWECLTAPDEVEVRIRVSRKHGMVLPDTDGKQEVVAVFKKMTQDDQNAIERLSSAVMEGPEDSIVIDYEKVRMLTIKRMLKETNLGFDIDFGRSDWMSPSSFKRVSSLPAPMVDALLRGYEKESSITEDEEGQIDKQCSILFSKHSRGVTGACEAVSLFCNLSNFWEKFGLNYFDVKRLPYKQYMLLRIMIARDNEAHAAHIKSEEKKRSAKPQLHRRGAMAPIVMPDNGG